MNRIICIGNPIYAIDRAGSEVFCNLKQRRLPENTELIDGGLDGLSLLHFVDGCEKILFVDNVSGFGSPNEVMVLLDSEIAQLATQHFEHLSGLPYLLKMLPSICEDKLPKIRIIGIESPHQPSAIEHASSLALALFNREKNHVWVNQACPSEVCT